MTDEPRKRGRPRKEPEAPKDPTIADLTIPEFIDLMRKIMDDGKSGGRFSASEIEQWRSMRSA